jgi:hypothetical protein
MKQRWWTSFISQTNEQSHWKNLSLDVLSWNNCPIVLSLSESHFSDKKPITSEDSWRHNIVYPVKDSPEMVSKWTLMKDQLSFIFGLQNWLDDE